MTSDTTIRISEIFGPTIQGEGALIGQPTVFVRTGGCDYRCTWCDTLYAVDSEFRSDWTPMSATDIMAKIESLSGNTPIMVTLSGGNPAIQPLGELIQLGHTKDYQFALETQGSIAQDWFAKLDILTLSPKPPSSDMDTDWSAFDSCIEAAGQGTEIALKIVIADEADYQYARQAADKYPDLPIYLQPCNPDAQTDNIDKAALNQKLQWLITRAAKDNWHTATILPQLHVLIWGNERGV